MKCCRRDMAHSVHWRTRYSHGSLHMLSQHASRHHCLHRVGYKKKRKKRKAEEGEEIKRRVILGCLREVEWGSWGSDKQNILFTCIKLSENTECSITK